MAITALPTAPQRTDSPDVFATRGDAWVAALDQFTTEANALQTDVNAKQLLAASSETAAELAETNAEAAQIASESARDLSIANASGTVTDGSSKDWATKTDGTVAGGEYSAKEYALGTIVSVGSAKDWATQTGSTVNGSEYSAKEYASGTTVTTGSAKEWAITSEDTLVDGLEYSAKHYAAKAAASVAVLPEGTINDLLTASDKTWSSTKITSEILEGKLIETITKTSLYTVLETDRSKLIRCSGSFNLNLSSAATLGNGWYCYAQNIGGSDITIEPYNTETIDGVANVILEPDNIFLVISDGTNLKCIRLHKPRPHYITSSQTWICPAGVYEVFVEIWGAGGGGSSALVGGVCPSGGGGAYSAKKIQITPGTSKSISIGAGGSGVAAGTSFSSPGVTGSNGGASSFSTDMTASGGQAGNINSPYETTKASSSGGDINIYGGSGSYQSAGNVYSFGINILSQLVSAGTDSTLLDGFYPGCGGGGRSDITSPTDYRTGNGSNGLCIIWY